MASSNREAILERLRSLASERLGIDSARINEGARLSDLGIDSFAIIELVFSVEEEFGIRVPLDGVVVSTIDDVVAVIQDRIDFLSLQASEVRPTNTRQR
jgi:acyl carrier protein